MDAKMLDKKLEKMCKKSKVVGANVALFNSKGIIYNYNYGFANKKKAIKSNNDSLYMIGSNTKLMTALGILKLREEGKLSLDDDIRKHIPEFQVKSYFPYDKITIENFMMHRSGLVSDLFHLILDKTRDYHEVIEELKTTYLTAIPGKMFSYSNVGYTLLGIIIERASGLSYMEYIQKEIASPMGIQVLFLKNEEDRKAYESCVSLCYDKKGMEVEDMLSTLYPAGSNTYMSMSDFVKFGQMFLNRANMEFMETLNLEDPIDKEVYNVGYGLIHKQYDFGEKVGKVLGHGGNTSCHHSVFNYIPNLDVGIAVMTNSENGVALSQKAAMTVLVEYITERGVSIEGASTEFEHINCDSTQYAGRYATAMGLMDIRLNEKKEYVSKLSGIPVKLQLCKDGYLQCMPIKLFHRLPVLKRTIQGMRLKPATYMGENILLFEQNGKYHKTKGIIGCRYEKTKITDSFREACGSYRISDGPFKNMQCKCSLKLEGDVLTLEIAALNVRLCSCLKTIDENLAIIQGFGRLSRQTVEIEKKENRYYLTFSGIRFCQL